MIESIRSRLAAHIPRSVDGTYKARAAILVPVYTLDGALHIVLTKRTDKVQSHKGEISFPGGAMDLTDADLLVTALRECDEEIGLRREHVRVMGRIDDIITVSSYHVTAYAGEIDPACSPYLWRPQASEVAEVLEVPLDHLMDKTNFVELPRIRDGELVLQPGLSFGEHVIWGATYRMLRNFLDVAIGPTSLPLPLAIATEPYDPAPSASVA